MLMHDGALWSMNFHHRENITITAWAVTDEPMLSQWGKL